MQTVYVPAPAPHYIEPMADTGARVRPPWRELMPLYEAAHRHPVTRAMHMFGIPMIVTAPLVALLVSPWLALGLFVGGWILQFVAHYVFEKNDPQFFGDPRNLLVGVIWSGIEWGRLFGLGRRHRRHGA
jgi:uncharacterized membrane protein YGL010W